MLIEVSARAVNRLRQSEWAVQRPEVIDALLHPTDFTGQVGVNLCHRVSLDVDTWLAIADMLEDVSTTEPGESKGAEGEAAAAHRAARKIARRVAELTSHPAFRGRGVPGHARWKFPAWKVEGDDRWWPSRRQAVESAVKQLLDGPPEEVRLHPVERWNRGRVFTVWEVDQVKAGSK